MSKERLPIVILLSGNGSNCQAIINASEQSLLISIRAVISDNPTAYGLTRARDAGISTCIIDRKLFDNAQSFDKALLSAIEQFSPKLIVLAGYMRIIGPHVLSHYAGQIVNIHPSLLPKYPGLNTHQQVLNNHDIEHGVSIHWVTKELDAGPLIAQAAIKVQPAESVEQLQERIHKLEHQMYPQVIQWVATHRDSQKNL